MTIADQLESLAVRCDRWSPGCGPRRWEDAWRFSASTKPGHVMVRRPDVRALEIGADVALLCLTVEREFHYPARPHADAEVWESCSDAMRRALRLAVHSLPAYTSLETLEELFARGLVVRTSRSLTPSGRRLHRYARGAQPWPVLIFESVGAECPCCEGSGDFADDPDPGCLNCGDSGRVLVDDLSREELLVQADRLQAEGDPRGEWLALCLTNAACDGIGDGCPKTWRAFRYCRWCDGLGTALASRHRDIIAHLNARAAA